MFKYIRVWHIIRFVIPSFTTNLSIMFLLINYKKKRSHRLKMITEGKNNIYTNLSSMISHQLWDHMLRVSIEEKYDISLYV